MSIEFEGHCHCSAIGYRFRTRVDPSEWTIRACDCSFCRMHDVLSTSGAMAEIEFFAQVPERMRRYRFGLQTADFLLCSNCGVYIGAVMTGDQGTFGIVNLRALAAPLENMAPVVAVSYAGEDRDSRITRREQRWAKARFAA
ncbi:MAG: hypothetical protein L0Y45_00935 [Woeseiaceae bacterium]|nr:hypothetical protein [Woeseiaceae bacterium]